MKIILSLTAILILSFITPQGNPLQNTRWVDPNGLVVYFTASDTVKLIIDDQLVMAAQYRVKDSVVTWSDFTPGPATCDTSIRGRYVYTIKDSLLSFRVLSDRCEERANIIQTLLLAREK